MEENATRSFETRLNELQVSENIKKNLLVTTQWSTFLSILGFVYIGLIVLSGLFMSVATSLFHSGMMYQNNMMYNSFFPFRALGGGIGLIYIVIAVIYFFPVFYLFKFSDRIKKSISTLGQQELEDGILHLKKFFKFIGIATIVLIGITVLAIPIAIITAITTF
ncbi:MAG: DUF5362 family protein [Paludibacter sp.]|nr:DUF5362 family protein [Paludibacter sp.]